MILQGGRHLAVLVAIGAMAAGAALSEEVAPEQVAPETTGDVVVGVQGLSEDPPNSAKFFEYRDVPSGFVAERIDLLWTPRPRFYFDIDAYDITQKDSRGVVELGRTDVWNGRVFWRDNPRLWGDNTRMLYNEQGDALFTLEDTFQSVVQVAPAGVDTSPPDGQWDAGTKGALIKEAIDQSAQGVFVGYQRKHSGVGATWTPTRSWTLDVDFERERRDGTTPQSLGNYFSLAPSEVAAPLDFRTDWAGARLEYTSRSWNLGGSVTLSRFETGYKSLTWDDQLSLVDQPVSSTLTSIPGRERLTYGVDNDTAMATLYGGVNLPGRTRIDVTASGSETTQDDPFLPMTINGQLSPLLNPLPAESYDGKHRYGLFQVRASSRPLSWFRWSAWGRQYELKNESPSLVFQEYVQTDYAIPLCGNANACGATTNRIQRRNLTYGYEKDSYGGLAGFKPVSWLDLSVSYERQDVTREAAAVEDSQEEVSKLTLDFDVNEQVTIRTTLVRSERRADHYDAEYHEESFPIGEAVIAAANEGERRFTWTDRDRDAATLFVEWSPDARWSVFAEGTYARDDYFDPNTGLEIGDSFMVQEDRDFNTLPESITLLLAGRTFDENTSATVGVTFSPTPRFGIYADYTWEEFRYRLVSRYRAPSAGIGSDNPADDWGSDADDEYQTANLGLNLDLNKDASWRLNLNGSWSRGTGDLTTDFAPGGSSSGDTTLTTFPQLDTRLTVATAQITHRIRKSLEYSVRYWYERWDEDNWAADQMQPYMGDPGNDPGSVNAIYLGMDFEDYTYQVLSLLLRYSF